MYKRKRKQTAVVCLELCYFNSQFYPTCQFLAYMAIINTYVHVRVIYMNAQFCFRSSIHDSAWWLSSIPSPNTSITFNIFTADACYTSIRLMQERRKHEFWTGITPQALSRHLPHVYNGFSIQQCMLANHLLWKDFFTNTLGNYWVKAVRLSRAVSLFHFTYYIT